MVSFTCLLPRDSADDFFLHTIKISFSCFIHAYKILFCFVLYLSSSTCFADPFNTGDVIMGKNLHNLNCVSCHNGMVPGGDGHELYLSDLRSIVTAPKLRSQVEFCANQNNIVWFE